MDPIKRILKRWTNWFIRPSTHELKIMYCIALQDSPGIKTKQKQMNPQRQQSAFIFLKLHRHWFTPRSYQLTFVIVQSLSCVLFVTPWTAAHQASVSFTISWSLLKLMSVESVMPSNHLILCRPQSFPASGSFPVSQLFASGGQIIGVSASVSVPLMTIQGWFHLRWTGSPCSSRDSQESSPAPQFEIVNYLVLSRFYGPPLTFIHDYWRNHSFDYTDFCWQSDVSAFWYAA